MKKSQALAFVAGLLLASYAALCEARLAGTYALVISDLTQSQSGPKVKLSRSDKEQLVGRFHTAERDWFHLEVFGFAVSAASFGWFLFERSRKERS